VGILSRDSEKGRIPREATRRKTVTTGVEKNEDCSFLARTGTKELREGRGEDCSIHVQRNKRDLDSSDGTIHGEGHRSHESKNYKGKS